MKKFASAILCILLVLAVASGCAGIPTTTSSGTTATTKATTTATTAETTSETTAKPSHTAIMKTDPVDLEWKEDTSPITFTLYHGGPAFIWLNPDVKWGDDKISREITKRTGVSIELMFDDQGDFTKLKLMMAAGDPLPDLIKITYSGQPFEDLKKDGFIFSLTDLMDQYAPKMHGLFHKGEEEICAIDGKFWGFNRSAYGLDEPNDKVFVWWGCYAFRNDILEALNVTEIKTTDDLLTVLGQVKEKYPDIKYPTVFTPSMCFPFYQAFGGKGGSVAAAGNELYYDSAADAVKFWWEDQDAGLSALKYMNKLYQLGYYNEELLTIITDAEKFASELGQGNVFMLGGPNVGGIWAANTTLAESGVPSNEYYRVLPPITAPGKKWHSMFNFTSKTGSGYVVSADVKDPKRVIRFLEFMVSDEGQALTMLGIEGEDYDTFTEPKTGLTFPKYKGERLSLIGAADFYTKTGNKLWGMYFSAYFQFIDIRAGLMQKPDDLASKLQLEATNAYTAPELSDSTSISMIGQASRVSADSEEGLIRTRINEFIEPQLSKIVLSKSDAEFDANYQALLDGVQSLEIEKWRVAATASAKEFKALMEKGGKVWTD